MLHCLLPPSWVPPLTPPNAKMLEGGGSLLGTTQAFWTSACISPCTMSCKTSQAQCLRVPASRASFVAPSAESCFWMSQRSGVWTSGRICYKTAPCVRGPPSLCTSCLHGICRAQGTGYDGEIAVSPQLMTGTLLVCGRKEVSYFIEDGTLMVQIADCFKCDCLTADVMVSSSCIMLYSR